MKYYDESTAYEPSESVVNAIEFLKYHNAKYLEPSWEVYTKTNTTGPVGAVEAMELYLKTTANEKTRVKKQSSCIIC